MIRFTKALAVTAVALMLPTAASALGISIVNVSESVANDLVVEVGESITFDLVLENSTGITMTGLDVLVYGHDETPEAFPIVSSGLTLAGGQVANQIFLPFEGAEAFPNVALDNIVSVPTDRHTLNLLDPEIVRTQLFGGININGTAGTGADDIGIGGSRISEGDVHFRVTYVNIPTQVQASNITMNFGVNIDLGAVAVSNTGIVPFSNDSIALRVIPEPGTALLMGLGLAGLATSRRR